MMAYAETVAERMEIRAVALADAPVLVIPKISLQEWADRILASHQKEVAAIIEKGRLLLAAKKALPHGQWERLFKSHPQAVANPVRFSSATARMYMIIAAHPVLSNRNLGNDLPPSWRTLYALTQLPHAMILDLLQKGVITPDSTRRAIEYLHENYELEQHGGDPDWRWKEHWQGMPEYVTEDQSPYRTIHLHFAGEAAVQAFAQLVGQKISEKTKSLWYPQLQRISAQNPEHERAPRQSTHTVVSGTTIGGQPDQEHSGKPGPGGDVNTVHIYIPGQLVDQAAKMLRKLGASLVDIPSRN